MKLAFFTLLTLCLVATCWSAEEPEYDYDEQEAAPVQPSTPARPAGRLASLSSSRARGVHPVLGRKSNTHTTAAPATTAKSVKQEQVHDKLEDAEEYDSDPKEGEEAVDEDSQEDVAPPAHSTTTELSKKLRTAGAVRPFRSNEDLLAALKRRRAQVGSSSSRESGAATTAATSATSQTTESSSSKSKSSTARNKSEGAASTRGQTRGRFGTARSTKATQEEVEETQREEVQVKAKPYRRG